MEEHLKSRMNDTIAQVGVLVNEWDNNSQVPEVDWTRIRSFEFQDRLNKRNTRLKRLEGSACVLCKEFEAHVCPASVFNLSG
jgi:antiviral helicase SKI2